MTKSYKFVFNHPYAVINWLQSEEKNKNQGAVKARLQVNKIKIYSLMYNKKYKKRY